MANTFNKQERLHSKKQIDLLFEKGSSLAKYPLKLVYLAAVADQPYPAQAMFVVPKRTFRNASDRNKLKRRMKEAYRLNKQVLYEMLGARANKLLLAFIYTGGKEEKYDIIHKSLCKQLEKLKEKII